MTTRDDLEEKGFDAGPFSMLAVSALENHVDTIEFLGKKYAAIKLGDEVEGGASLTQCMVFCRGLLGYNDQQQVVLHDMMGGGPVVNPGDWIVMVSRTEYTLFRMHGNDSLFSLMPQVPKSTYWARLKRISEAHKKDVDGDGGTHGVCIECYQTWDEEKGGCPTKVWATTDRDILDTWDPRDSEPDDEAGPGLDIGDSGPTVPDGDPLEEKPTRREVANAEKVMGAAMSAHVPADVYLHAEDVLERAQRMGIGADDIEGGVGRAGKA